MSAEGWLVDRIGDAPDHLVSLMLEAIRLAESTTIPERLAEGALLLYKRVVAGNGDRADAFPLLAADALLTHAFQAMAEADPGKIQEFADRWTASEELARLAR